MSGELNKDEPSGRLLVATGAATAFIVLLEGVVNGDVNRPGTDDFYALAAVTLVLNGFAYFLNLDTVTYERPLKGSWRRGDVQLLSQLIGHFVAITVSTGGGLLCTVWLGLWLFTRAGEMASHWGSLALFALFVVCFGLPTIVTYPLLIYFGLRYRFRLRRTGGSRRRARELHRRYVRRFRNSSSPKPVAQSMWSRCARLIEYMRAR